jgi:hypothetical protein
MYTQNQEKSTLRPAFGIFIGRRPTHTANARKTLNLLQMTRPGADIIKEEYYVEE